MGAYFTWDIAKRQLLSKAEGKVSQVVMHPRDHSIFALFTVEGEDELHVGDIRSGRMTLYLKGPAFRRIALSQDGKYLVGSEFDNTISLRLLVKKDDVVTFRGHPGPIYCIAYDDKRQRIISGSEDKTVRIWDVRRRKESQRFTTSQAVRCLAVSPCGKFLAAGCGTATVSLKSGLKTEKPGALFVWGLDTNKLVLHHKTKGALVNSLTFDLQSKQLFAGTSHGLEVVDVRER